MVSFPQCPAHLAKTNRTNKKKLWLTGIIEDLKKKITQKEKFIIKYHMSLNSNHISHKDLYSVCFALGTHSPSHIAMSHHPFSNLLYSQGLETLLASAKT